MLDVVVIGGGQAGLSVGYHLTQTGAQFVILDAHERTGDSWRNRWDSLRLFTSANFAGLDGMPFPAPRHYFPTKNEMADYLEAYARRFHLPVRNGVRVERLSKRGGRYIVTARNLELEAQNVVVAMSQWQQPKVPAFAALLASDVTQLHSLDYRNVCQLRPGGVLLVGAGNSGADIALDVARAGHTVWLAGPDTGQAPLRPESFLARNLFTPLLLRFIFPHVLSVNTALGRVVRRIMVNRGAPRIRVRSSDLAAAGVRRVPRVVGVRDGMPLLEDSRSLTVANVLWCSGFHAGFDWIDLPIFDEHGEPKHRSGHVEGHAGLYLVGLPYLHSVSSAMIDGVRRDAARIVRAISTRIRLSR